MGKRSYKERVKEQRMAIRLCYGWGKTGEETHKLIKGLYGKDAMSRTQIYNWYARFKAGRESTEDDPRPGRYGAQGSSQREGSEEMVKKVRKLTKSLNRRPTIREIATKLRISYRMSYEIVTFLQSENESKQAIEETVPSSTGNDGAKEKQIPATDSKESTQFDLEGLEMKLKMYLQGNAKGSSSDDAVSYYRFFL